MVDTFSLLQKYTGISKYSKSEVITPQNIVYGMVDILPTDVFNPDTTFLDTAVKSGRFLVEIYSRLMTSDLMKQAFPNEQDRRKHILENQLYGLATSPFAAVVARKAIYNDPTISGNIIYVDSYLAKMADKTTDFKKLVQGEFGENMKFDVVIGNPPYQEDTGGGNSGAMPLYHKFVIAANEIADRCFSLIIPSLWFVSSRSECAAVRDVILTDSTRYIRDFRDASTVFDGVQIAGGVCYFVTDKKYHGLCTVDDGTDKWKEILDKRMFIRNKVVSSVFSKIKAHGDFNVLTTQKMNAFGLKRAECGSAKHSTDTEIKVHSSGLYTGWLERSDVYKGTDLIDQYNVITDYGTSGVNITFRIGMIKPGEVCTLTYYVIRSFDTEAEALNCIKYLRTRFVKFMIEATICNATITDKNFVLVPNQTFSTDGIQDIDWSQSLEEVDEQLFKKYKLSDDEVAYIKKTIKPTV